jgi:DNA-binding IclR family transcriptional regulator
MADQNQSVTYKIDILDVALDVIEQLVAAAGEAKRPSEIASELGINRTRVFRILKSLEQRGYVEYSSDSQGYRVGLKFLEIGSLIKHEIEPQQIARPVLSELARITGETTYLVIRYNQQAVCVNRYQGNLNLQISTKVGQPLPLYAGASPKILLAYLPLEEQEQIIQKMELVHFTNNTIVDREKLRERLKLIRSRGYEIDEEDLEIGAFAIGAPVFNNEGDIVASITLAVPGPRFNTERKNQLIPVVVNTARRISAELGYSPGVF